MDLLSAFQDMRGGPGELFTKFPDGKISDSIHFAVEMLVNRKIQDELGREFELNYTRLRYELLVVRRSLQHLYVKDESLKAIPRSSDEWCKKYLNSSAEEWLSSSTDEEKTFMDANNDALPLPPELVHHRSNAKFINVYPDGKVVNDGVAQFNTDLLKRTFLSSAISFNYPHLLAAHQDLRALNFLHLHPDSLRKSSSVFGPGFLLSDGSNLPTTLARMLKEDKFALAGISRDLANLVPDLTTIELKEDESRNEYTIWATYQDGRSFSSRVLSDGTLQLLALVALKNDPQFSGVLCFEEPENGVHPSYLTAIAHLLRGLATDFSDPEQAEEPLRQVLVTTHSPAFISQPDVRNALLLTYTMTRVEPSAAGIPPMRVTHAAPVLASDKPSPSGPAPTGKVDKWEASYTIDQVKELLTGNYLDETLKNLDDSRVKLGTEE